MLRPGVRLGIDVGRARIGVARCDPSGMLAVPVETVARSRSDDGMDIRRVLELATEYEAVEIVVGNPIALSGRATASTADAMAFARGLMATGTPVRLVDERLSTVSAQHSLRSAGRRARTHRSVIDQAAAVIILQHALDSERTSGRAAGVSLSDEEGPTHQ